MKILMALLALALLGACSTKHELAKCKGPLIALNGDLWSPSDDEMKALGKLCPEDR